MMYVFLGLVILVVSFLIALLTLIREQRNQEKQQERLNQTESLEQQFPFQPSPILPQENTSFPNREVFLDKSESPGLGLNRRFEDSPSSNSLGTIEPFPWDGKQNEVGITSTKLTKSSPSTGSGDLARGGEFVIPRSVTDKD